MVKEKHLRSVAFFQGSAFKQLRGKFYTISKRYQKHSILNRPNKLFGLNFALNQSLKKTRQLPGEIFMSVSTWHLLFEC